MNILVIGTEKSIHDFKWISYLAMNTSHAFFFISETPNESDDHYKHKYELAGVKLLPPLPPFSLSAIGRTIKGWRRIKGIIREHKIDLVHVIFPTPQLYWMTFSRTPILVSTRGSDVLVVMKSLLEGSGIKEKALKFLTIRNLRKTSKITSTSELQKIFLEKHFDFLRGKVQIVRTGINIDFVESVPIPEESSSEIKTIFSPRFFSPIYNILSQIEALKYLSEDLQRTIKIVFVRGTEYNKMYETEIKKALSNVLFTYEIRPYLTPEEMVLQYKRSNLVIMTPLSDGTPNSALEAMVCKKPLIISKLNYQSPLFESTCLMANPRDARDIYEQMKLALTNYPMEYLDAGYNAVKQYGNQQTEMDKVAVCYQDIYNEKYNKQKLKSV